MFLLLPLIAKADCSWLEKLSIKKFEKLPIRKITRIGGNLDANDICTFSLAYSSNGVKKTTSYLFKGEASIDELTLHGSETEDYSEVTTKEFDPEGGSIEREYVFGKIQGLVTKRYKNRKLHSEEVFLNNAPIGIQKVFSQTENVSKAEKIKDISEVKKIDAPQIEVAKQKCANLGFTEKTEKFGICVLEILK